jgi:hypothetical protein
LAGLTQEAKETYYIGKRDLGCSLIGLFLGHIDTWRAGHKV